MPTAPNRSVPVFGHQPGGNGLTFNAQNILSGLFGNSLSQAPPPAPLGPSDPHGTPLGIDSPTSQLFGHNPSPSRAIENEDWKNPEWMLDGGASLGASVNVGVMNNISQALGLGRASETLASALGLKKKDYSTEEWGTNEQNRGRAGEFNFGTYGTLNSDVKAAFGKMNPTDENWIAQSFDIDGDRRVSENEYYQWHHTAHGAKEGRPIDLVQTLTDILNPGTLPVAGNTQVPTSPQPQTPLVPQAPARPAAPIRQLRRPTLPRSGIVGALG